MTVTYAFAGLAVADFAAACDWYVSCTASNRSSMTENPATEPATIRIPRASIAVRSLAVTAYLCAKKSTSSDHCRRSCACSTEPGPIPITPIG